MAAGTRRVRKRRISAKALVYATAGAEPPYPVYTFSRGKKKLERPGHNPFRGL